MRETTAREPVKGLCRRILAQDRGRQGSIQVSQIAGEFGKAQVDQAMELVHLYNLSLPLTIDG